VSHRYGDERIVEWLSKNGYHPRSPAHGSASCLFLLDDLLYQSDPFRERAEGGRLVYQEDFTVGTGDSAWNTDLVVGPPAADVGTDATRDRAIAEAEPDEVWLAVDAKSVMTEHGKARRNRQRDINSFADIMHRHYPGVVTGGVLLINAAKRFKSPLRDEDDITVHDRIETLVRETVDIFRDIERADGEISPNVDGVGCVVVDHTNMDDGRATSLVTEAPAPGTGEIVHYRNLVEILASALEGRFLTGDAPDMEVLRETDRLGGQLRRQAVHLSHRVYQINQALGGGGVNEEDVASLRETLDDLQRLAEELEDL
jgi:hypothetical protein